MQTQAVIDRSVWIRYLTVYNGDDDWDNQIYRVYKELLRKHSETEAAALMRKILACTVLLPTQDRSHRNAESPSSLLFKCRYYHQFEEKDWVADFYKVLELDEEIQTHRNKALSLGIVDPVDYAPVTRQAFNWLFDSAVKSGAVTDSNKEHIKTLCQRLVWAYGGTVVCSVFRKEQRKVDQISNWKTNYFFERLIYEVFTPEQILQVKHQELQQVNKKLVKKIEGQIR